MGERVSAGRVRGIRGHQEAIQREAGNLQFRSLEAFRPLAERASNPQVAEAQRREFFNQLHRWLRQDYSVHVFCNNDGERQRFEEVWKDLVGEAPLTGTGFRFKRFSLTPALSRWERENGTQTV